MTFPSAAARASDKKTSSDSTACGHESGKSVCFTSLDDMIRKLRNADQAGDLGRQLRGYLRTSTPIIDEVGYLPLSGHDANLVIQIIARRYEKGSIIIIIITTTSNKAFSKPHMFERTCVRQGRSFTGS